MTPRRPWMKFYPSDWRADPRLRQCEPVSRYCWLEMCGLMHEAEPYGHLIIAGKPIDPTRLARLIGMDRAEVESAIEDLEAHGVFSRDESGIIYSRRMVRDEEKHRRASGFGKKGVEAKALKEKENPKPLEPPHEGSLEGAHKPPLKPRGQSPDKPPVAPQKGGKAEKVKLPEDWEPSDFGEGSQSRAICEAWSALEFETQLERFRAHHRKEGSLMADWQSAWSTWVLNSRRFAERDERREKSSGPRDFADIVLDELAPPDGRDDDS